MIGSVENTATAVLHTLVAMSSPSVFHHSHSEDRPTDLNESAFGHPMELHVEHHHDREHPTACVVHASGEIDILTSPTLLAALGTELRDPQHGNGVVVDLTDVTFLDSTALGALVGARKLADSIGSTMIIRLPEGDAVRTLELTGLSDYLTR